MWNNLPKVTNHKLDLKAFYALGTNFIHIITQKLQISHSSQISLSKQSKQVHFLATETCVGWSGGHEHCHCHVWGGEEVGRPHQADTLHFLEVSTIHR